jgi:hypothetical protein
MTAPGENLPISFCTGCFPLVLIGNVKDQQMILSRRLADFVSLLRGKLDVIGLPWMTEDDAVETALILELSDYCKPEALLIHLSDGDKVIVGLVTRIIEPGFKR